MADAETLTASAKVLGALDGRAAEILNPQALEFLAGLHRRFNGRRLQLLAARAERQKLFDAGETPDFLQSMRHVREGDWKVAPIPPDLQDRRVEITGPVDRKMIINALNCGANVFMADFEDATTPSWANLIDGQSNLMDAVRRQIDYTDPQSGKAYRLNDKTAVLFVRPRGWHLPEMHVLIDGKPMSGALFDFGPGPTSIFPRWRATWKRGCGTTSSSTASRRWA